MGNLSFKSVKDDHISVIMTSSCYRGLVSNVSISESEDVSESHLSKMPEANLARLVNWY